MVSRVAVPPYLGLGRLSKYFCLLFYSFILNALAYYSFTVTYYSHYAYRKNEGCGQNNTNNYTNNNNIREYTDTGY